MTKKMLGPSAVLGYRTPVRVLLVDNEPRFLMNLSSRLRNQEGFRVETCEEVSAALKRLKEAAFDVAVVDLLMVHPRTGEQTTEAGLWLLERVKASEVCSGTEVIILTGVGAGASAAVAMSLGAYTYIDKTQQGDVILPEMIRHAAVKRRTYAVHRELWERLRVALSVASGYSAADLQDPELLRETLSQMQHAASLVHLSDLMARGASQLSVLFKQVCSWRDTLIRWHSALTDVAQGSGVQLLIECAPDVQVQIDEIAIRSCLTYLTSDIREGLPPGCVTLRSGTEGRHLVVTIADDYDQELLGENAPERAGFVLVDAIIAAHQGRLSYSRPKGPGRGNEVIICLPLA